MKQLIDRIKSFLVRTYPMPYWELGLIGVFFVLAWLD